MQLIQQPPDSHLCGQCCVAMLLGVTLDEAIELMGGKINGTRHGHLREALRARGLKANSWLIRGAPAPDATAVLKVGYADHKGTHWIVQHERRIYDPSPWGLWPLGWHPAQTGRTGTRVMSHILIIDYNLDKRLLA